MLLIVQPMTLTATAAPAAMFPGAPSRPRIETLKVIASGSVLADAASALVASTKASFVADTVTLAALTVLASMSAFTLPV